MNDMVFAGISLSGTNIEIIGVLFATLWASQGGEEEDNRRNGNGEEISRSDVVSPRRVSAINFQVSTISIGNAEQGMGTGSSYNNAQMVDESQKRENSTSWGKFKAHGHER
ncbi:hypothetical protein K435DRAFT_869656 [Dendrothele bispora CBS 962.96]|uniref:Uncharacterized protein n=1 Tax=Dendrothele bispora (strain CBS 962.96) TaxID=1314807 RepID=A0A4S8L941_DENBC|nr:hypothetical protein K435DRAFT_869656 [Dendrothele bispora CBS 962.96]